MKDLIKAVLTTIKDNTLTFSFTGSYLQEAKAQIKKLKAVPGTALEVSFDKVNKKRTLAQNSTWRLLVDIFYNSGYPSDKSYLALCNRLKYQYGAIEYFELADGSVKGTLKSTAYFTLKEFMKLIQGTIDEMLMSGFSSKRFDDMIIKWNSFKEEKNGR